MSMLQLDFRLPEFGNLVKDWGLKKADAPSSIL